MTISNLAKPDVALSGSIAFDNIMSFNGSFADHIIPEKTHVISLSFLVESLKRQRGGVAGNVAYNLALLGSPSYLIGAVGSDFGPYGDVFEKLGIDLQHVVTADDELTASAFMMADLKDNQIASFFPGPGDRAAEIDVQPIGDTCQYSLVGATSPAVMNQHADQFGSSTSRMIYDPAFQIILLSGEDLKLGTEKAWCVIGNDYEFAMMERKTGWSIEAVAERVELVVVTYGGEGSELIDNGNRVKVPVAPISTIADPTGAGDAYRSGLIKGLLLEQDLEVVGRVAGLAAAYAVEHVGTQEHSYTPAEFITRFDKSFPDFAGSLVHDNLKLTPSSLSAAAGSTD